MCAEVGRAAEVLAEARQWRGSWWGGRNGKVSGVRGVWCGVCNLEMDANFPRAGAPLRCWARSLLRARLEETRGRNGTGYCGDRQQQGSSRGRGSGGPAWWGTDDRGSVSSHHLPRGVPSRWWAVRRTLARAMPRIQLAKLFKAAVPRAAWTSCRAECSASSRDGGAVGGDNISAPGHGGGATVHPYALCGVPGRGAGLESSFS